MKTNLLIIAICLFSFTAIAQKQIYESPKLKQVIPTHKIVAILPFGVRITYKHLPKNYDATANRQQELETHLHQLLTCEVAAGTAVED